MSAGDAPTDWQHLARSAARPGADAVAAAPPRRLLTFTLCGSPYALPVERVREIVRLRPITPVPRVPAEVLGVVSLRGQIVQVIDLRRRLGLAAEPPGPRARIVIAQGEDERVAGLLVDAVTEVVSVAEDSLQPPTAETAAVAGLFARGEVFVSVVDVERVWRFDAGR